MNTNKTFQYGNEAGGEKEERRCGQTSPTLNKPSAFADPLWSKLRQFRFDTPDTTFHFATRLAHENGWTAAFTARVLEEYRRFLFLAVRAGHPVSPSDAVDQAWHLHLLYTESYWGELCPQVLGQPFHHGPSKGGAAEDRKFTDWYERTLDSYARFFGQRPPADIWPPVAIRFRGKKRYQRVCLNEAWVIPKPRLPRSRATLAAAGLVACPVLLAEADADDPTIAWIILIALCIVILIILVLVMKAMRGGTTGPTSFGCSSADCGGGEGGGSHHGGHHDHGGHHGGDHGGHHSGHDGGSHGGHDGGGGGHSCGGHSCGGGGHGCGGSSCGGGSCGGGGH